MLASSFSVSAGEQADNLLKNPTFFDFHVFWKRGVAEFWADNSGWADLDVEYSQYQSNSGLSAQKIDCIRFKSGAVQFVQPGVQLKEGAAYRVNVRLKGDVKSPVGIMLRKKGAPYTIYFNKEVKVQKDWKEFSFVGVAPQSDADACFMIRFTDKGTLFIDNAELRELSDNILDDGGFSGNALNNGGFEVGIDRWGIKVREAGSYEYAMDVDFSNPKPKIVEGGAFEGDRFLRLGLPENSSLRITSPYVQLPAGRQFTLSCSLAADPPRSALISIEGGSWNSGPKTNKKKIEIGKEWKKYSLSLELPQAPENKYYFMLESVGPGQLDVDAISLQETAIDNYVPAKDIEVGFVRENTAKLFSVGEQINLQVRTANYGGADAVLTVKAYDFWDRPQKLFSASLIKQGVGEFFFELPSDKTGYFRLVAEVGDKNGIIDVAEMAVGILPEPSSSCSIESSPFGAHFRFNEEMLDYASMLGVKWLRMHPPEGTKWFIVEKEKGKFKYSDAQILMAKKKGFNILGLLSSTPRWASSAPEELTSEAVGSFRSYPPVDLADWENYVFKTVEHYKGIIDHWEVWNEPDTSFFKVNWSADRARAYTRLLKAAYAAAKKANPEVTIIGGCASQGAPSAWFGKIFSKGAYDYMDALSFHRYTDGRPGDAMPVPTSSYVDELRRLMDEYGNGAPLKPVWETESGLMQTATNYGNIEEFSIDFQSSPKDAAAYLVRNYTHLLASGVEKWFYYNGFVSSRIDRREAAGFFEWDGSPRPLAVAYAVLSNIIGCSDFKEYVETNPHVAETIFEGPGKRVAIIWGKEENAAADFSLDANDAYTYEVFDLMGKKLVFDFENSKIPLPQGGIPVYIIRRTRL